MRLVLRDGRRLDLAVAGERMTLPSPPADVGIRFDAALAAARFGRGDELIGTHLALGIARECLVLAMRLRDGDERTDRHRVGTDQDRLASEVREIVAALPGDGARPDPIERLVSLYGEWRHELEAGYRPDWSGLAAVIERGRGIRSGARGGGSEPG